MSGTYDDASEVTDYDDDELEEYERYLDEYDSHCEDLMNDGEPLPQRMSLRQWRTFA